MKNKAFTVLELLIVMAITALLCGILLPVIVGSSKKKSSVSVGYTSHSAEEKTIKSVLYDDTVGRVIFTADDGSFNETSGACMTARTGDKMKAHWTTKNR